MAKSFCPDCGRPLAVNTPGGMCPACLLGLGAPAEASQESGGDAAAIDTADKQSEEPEHEATRIGRYKLLEIIGEGGFGTVWMAEQEQPVRRQVALKVIKLGMDTRQVVARFEAERQALALMDHPNIARVLDAGATEVGRPYFVMELVRGVPITEFCDARRLNTRERLELFIAVCQAVQHAHQKGVIHRDLKPSNILVTEQDGRAVPKIIDFGVAKAIEEPLTDKTLFTRFHQFLGTPAYMSPEQAGLGGLDIDTRSDIYSLGVLLYELLTGQPPLDPRQLREAGYESILKTIREVEPPKPSTQLRRRLSANRLSDSARAQVANRDAEIDQDLDSIVLKALEKDRARRYESANGLAADLRRYLDDEPVVARPPSNLYRFQKLARRNKLLFAAGGTVIVALVVGLVATYWQKILATRHLAQARLNAYVAEVNVAQRELAENNLAHALELIERQRPKPGETDLRGFEWRYLWQLCQSVDSGTLGDEVARGIDFSTDGRWLAYGGWTNVIVRETASREEVAMLKLNTPAESVSFSPDGHLLATAGQAEVVLWDTRTWRESQRLPGVGGAALFSPDGKWLLTGQTNMEFLVLWECATWTPVAQCPVTPAIKHYMRHALAFSPDSKMLVTLWVDFMTEKPSGLRFWKVPSLELSGELFPDRMPLACAAFDPDGATLLTGSWDGRLAVWDMTKTEPRLIGQSREHSTHITRIAVSGGKVFATAGEDQTISLWERGSWQHLARLRGHTNQIDALAISADGRIAATGDMDGVLKLWRTDRTSAIDLLNVGSLIAGFTPNSRTLVLGPRQGDYRWHLPGRDVAAVDVSTNLTLPETLLNKPFDILGNQPLGLLGRTNGVVEVWELAKGTQISSWVAETNGIEVVIFSPNGAQITTGSTTGNIKTWDAATHLMITALQPCPKPVMSLAYSPDGRVLAVGCDSSPVFIWDVDNGRELTPLPFRDPASWLSYSPDGRKLAVANMKGSVKLVDLPSRNLLAELKGHVMGVLRAEFVPDGKTLVTGSLDGRVKFWNLTTYQEILTITVPLGGTFRSLCVAPDGRTLAVGYFSSPGHHVQLHFAPSLQEITAIVKDWGRTFRP
jgi:eukaryotic-like serine/threonine-protein kinase